MGPSIQKIDLTCRHTDEVLYIKQNTDSGNQTDTEYTWCISEHSRFGTLWQTQQKRHISER